MWRMSANLHPDHSVYSLQCPAAMLRSVLLLGLAGCAGTIDSGGPGDPTTDAPQQQPPGVDAPDQPSGGSLHIAVTTTPNGGNFAPRNVVAVWVENNGAFVKTIDRWAATRKGALVAWKTVAGTNDVDAVSGATRQNHNTPLSITWDLLDKANAPIPDGTYTIRMELADSNASQPAQNHQGTFTFTKGATAESQTNLSNGGFTNVSIDFTP